MPYDVEAIRKKIKATMAGKFTDPDEFRPDKAKSATEAVKYRFFFLPPYEIGDIIHTGEVTDRGMDSQFFVAHGNHWVHEKPHPCPRVWSHDECKICAYGFDLLKDEAIAKDDEKRRGIVKQWMPTTYYMTNIFFTKDPVNPEELRGRVMVYNAPKTVLDVCTSCLMRDDAGDPEAPEAYGAFFDENNAFVFEVQILKQGRQNSYKTSKFLTTPRPMIRTADGKADTAQLTRLLALRHNLFSKIDLPDLAKLERVYQLMVNGDEGPTASRGGFDRDETKAPVTNGPPAGKVDPGTPAVATSKAKTVVGPTESAIDDGFVESAAEPKPAPVKPAPPAPAKPVPAKPVPAKPVPAKPAPAHAGEDPLAGEVPYEEPAAVGAPPTGIHTAELDSLLAQLEDNE